MRWNRIVFKLGGTIIFLFLIILMPLGFVIDQIFSGFYYGKVKEDNNQVASQYASLVANSRGHMTVAMIEMMAGFSQVKLYIVDERGEIVANAGVAGIKKGSTLPIREMNELSSGVTIEKEYVDPIGNRFLVSGRPIIQDNRFHGGVFVLSSIEAIHQSVKKIRELLFLSGIGAFFLALGFTFVLSRKLSDPLLQMELATRKIAKGDLDTRVKVTSGDEIGSLAQAINDLAMDLQRYRDTRSEFFANISHELRTPVTYLEGYAKVVKEGLYETDEEKEQYIDIIHQEAIRLTRLIHDLFELSKMEEGKINLNLEWIDLSEVLDNTILKTRLKAKHKGLDIHVELEGDLPLVYGDGLRMEQIFINLLDNAIRYTERGAVSVTMRSVDHDLIKITIEDTGLGISKDELPYIFERFYRIEKSRSREHGGTGLGLAIVKKLVEIQGGTIEVSSEVGKGTRFEILFRTSSNIQHEEGER
jgi:signal transduction histidine kinase